MTRKCGFVVLLTALSHSQAFANSMGWEDGNLGTGIILVGSQAQVEIQDYNLEIQLYTHYAEVVVDYTLVNLGEARTIKMAFPCLRRCEEHWKTRKVDCKSEIDQYSIKAGEREITALLEEVPTQRSVPDEEGRGTDVLWYVSRLAFEDGETRKVRISYRSIYLNDGESISDMNDRYGPDKFRYLLSTAKGWKGSIRKGRIQILPVRYKRSELSFNQASRFQESQNGGWVWEFADLSPTVADDIEISMGNDFQLDNSEILTWKGKWYRLLSAKAAGSSSVLASQMDGKDKFTYDPELAIDRGGKFGDTWRGPLDSCWCEGVSGNGEGESVSFVFARPTRLTHIGIVSGVARKSSLYAKNNRLAEVDVIINDNKKFHGELVDEYSYSWNRARSWQWVALGSAGISAEKIRVVISKVVPGVTGNSCISDIAFLEEVKTKPDIRRAR